MLTALENVELPLLLTSLSKKERRERALTALKVVGLADRGKHYPRQLSGGQEQRVAIARAIVTDPAVLVADEPTGDLDAKSAEDILNLLQTLNKDFKKTIVMVTHDPRAASRAHVERHLEKGVLDGDRRAARGDGGQPIGASREIPSLHPQAPEEDLDPDGQHRAGDGAVHLPDLRAADRGGRHQRRPAAAPPPDRLVTRHRVSLVFPLPQVVHGAHRDACRA